MKMWILFYLFFSFLDPFLSSPITIKDVDAYNKTVEKLETSMKAMMPKIDDYLSQMNLALKKQEGKGEEKSVTTSKPIENKERLDEAYTSSSEKNDKKSLDNATSDRRKDNFDEAKTNGKLIQRDRDSGHSVQATVFIVTTPKSHEKLVIRSTGIHSDRIPIQISSNKNTSNEQASNKKSDKVNSVQKNIPDNGNNNTVLNAEALDQIFSLIKVSSKLGQENKGIFNNLNTGLINQNKSSTIGDNPGNGLFQNRYFENLETQTSGTNREIAKNNQKIDTALITSKAEVTNPKENSNVTNKTFSSTEVSGKYQNNLNYKVKLTPSTFDQNEIDIMRMEKPNEIENHTKKEENSSVASSTGYDKQHEKRPTKDTGETLEKIKFGENGQVATEKKIMNHSISTAKPNDSGPKSKKVDVKLNDSGAKSLKAEAKLNYSGAISQKADDKPNDSSPNSKKVDAKLNYSGAKSLKAGAKLNDSGAISPKTDAKLDDFDSKSLKVDNEQPKKGSPNVSIMSTESSVYPLSIIT